ncbi:MAG: discoidin domain-containing protein [Gemmataceae bacterium]|nr:discoidin domain-containing protein [Gemmataceae bacterium]
MSRFGAAFLLLVAFVTYTALGQQSKTGPRTPTYGGGPVESPHSVKYDAETLKAQNVPEIVTDNKNSLVLKFPGKLLLSSSSIWDGWPEALAFDGNPHSSWFTAKGDAVAHGTNPWIQVTFPADVTIKRITILGNRDPRWLKGFTILAGTIELFDVGGKKLDFHENDGTGRAYDYDWKLKAPVANVRTVRFNALGDQGKENQYDDIAVGELQIE